MRDDLAVLIAVDDHVLGGGDEAMLDPAVAAERFLVSAGVEKADVQRLLGIR